MDMPTTVLHTALSEVLGAEFVEAHWNSRGARKDFVVTAQDGARILVALATQEGVPVPLGVSQRLRITAHRMWLTCRHYAGPWLRDQVADCRWVYLLGCDAGNDIPEFSAHAVRLRVRLDGVQSCTDKRTDQVFEETAELEILGPAEVVLWDWATGTDPEVISAERRRLLAQGIRNQLDQVLAAYLDGDLELLECRLTQTVPVVEFEGAVLPGAPVLVGYRLVFGKPPERGAELPGLGVEGKENGAVPVGPVEVKGEV